MAREIHDTIAHGPDRDRDPAGGRRAGERPAGRLATATSTTPSRLARESLTEARRSVEASRPEALEGATLEDGAGRRRRALVGAQRRAGRRSPRPATPCRSTPRSRSRCCAPRRRRSPTSPSTPAPTRAGLTLSYMGDVVTLDVRDDGVGFEVPDGSRAGRSRRLRADRHAPAGRPRRGHARGRVRARRRHRDLGPRAGDRRPAGRSRRRDRRSGC